jgi:hypothetical protein
MINKKLIKYLYFNNIKLFISSKMGKYANILFLFFLFKIFSSTPELETFDVTIILNDTNLEGLLIDDKSEKKVCNAWIPSLFMPLLYISDNKETKEAILIPEYSGKELFYPVFYKNKSIGFNTYQEIKFLNKKYQSKLMKDIYHMFNYCYFGLSHGVNNFIELKEEDVTLNYLKEKDFIKKKIFSFDIWDLNKNKTTFYLGDSHEDFNSNAGIIGTCNSYSKDSPWGCSFKKMLFNNINIPLEDNIGTLYKIYFSSETHDLIFPNSFKDIFKNSTNNSCFPINEYLSCPDFFKVSKYFPIQMTEKNDNFVITGQVDSILRYNTKEKNKKDYARIQFDDINCIILPLIVFKEFHVQFDAESNLIKFYTKDSNILKVKEIKKEGSSALTIFLVILVILILLGLSIAAFLFIKNKRNTESNINKFSKFEDEEDYKNLNEKKVF